MRLLAPVARIVIFPPAPGAAASSRERGCPVLLTLMATPVGASLFKLILPPDRLFRRGEGGAVEASAEETVMAEFTEIVPPGEFRFTVPPAPLGSDVSGRSPV